MLVRLGVDPVIKIGDDGRERLLRLLMEVGDGDASGKDGIVRMFGGKVSCGLGGKILNVSDAGEHELTSSSTVVTLLCTPRVCLQLLFCLP